MPKNTERFRIGNIFVSVKGILFGANTDLLLLLFNVAAHDRLSSREFIQSAPSWDATSAFASCSVASSSAICMPISLHCAASTR